MPQRVDAAGYTITEELRAAVSLFRAVGSCVAVLAAGALWMGDFL